MAEKDCSGRAVKAAAGHKVSGPGSIPAAPTSRDSLMTALGAGNKYPEAQGLGLGKPRFLVDGCAQLLVQGVRRSTIAPRDGDPTSIDEGWEDGQLSNHKSEESDIVSCIFSLVEPV